MQNHHQPKIIPGQFTPTYTFHNFYNIAKHHDLDKMIDSQIQSIHEKIQQTGDYSEQDIHDLQLLYALDCFDQFRQPIPQSLVSIFLNVVKKWIGN